MSIFTLTLGLLADLFVRALSSSLVSLLSVQITFDPSVVQAIDTLPCAASLGCPVCDAEYRFPFPRLLFPFYTNSLSELVDMSACLPCGSVIALCASATCCRSETAEVNLYFTSRLPNLSMIAL